MNEQNGAGRVEVVPGTSTKDEFAGATSMALAETQSSALAAQVTASVQARYIMALKNPRDWDDVRVRVLAACKRPRFAETARYLKPVGKGVEGWSVRFAEECVRTIGNVFPETITIYDDRSKRIVRQSVTDLERNVTYSLDVTIDKTVERSKLKDGQQPIAVRTNSSGYKVFIVEATEDDLLNKQNALVSKALRTNALRLIPSDILEECLDQVYRTQQQEDAKDPDAARKRLIDAFASIGVKPSDIKTYLGHDLASSSPAEIAELRAVYAAIRDGEGTWVDAIAAKAKSKQDSPDAPKQQTTRERVAAAKNAATGKGSAPVSEKPTEAKAAEPRNDIHPDTGEVVPPPGAGDAWEPDGDEV